MYLHAEDMPHPSYWSLDDDRIDAGGFSTGQDFKVGGMILPTYSQYKPNSMHVEVFQLLNVPAVWADREK